LFASQRREATRLSQPCVQTAAHAAMRGEDVVVVPWTIHNGQAVKWKEENRRRGVDGHRSRAALCRLLDNAPRKAVTIVTGALGRLLTEAGYRKAFRTLILRLLKEEKVAPGLTIYGLQHTNGDMLADLGADPRMIQALLGQRSMAAALRYSQGADRRRAASAAMHLLECGRTKLARVLGKSGGKSVA
jgi:integrase